jgi:hypothetical protein
MRIQQGQHKQTNDKTIDLKTEQQLISNKGGSVEKRQMRQVKRVRLWPRKSDSGEWARFNGKVSNKSGG